jgi:hypothetical protein
MGAADYHKQSAEQMKADVKRGEEIEQLLAEKFERWSTLEAKAALLAKREY